MIRNRIRNILKLKTSYHPVKTYKQILGAFISMLKKKGIYYVYILVCFQTACKTEITVET